MSNFDAGLHLLLKHEGGYVDYENDQGGATKYGISLRYLRHQKIINADFEHDGDIDEKDLNLLTMQEVNEIYKKAFWNANNLSEVKSQRVANMIFGLCVNMGAKRAIIILQQSLNAIADKHECEAERVEVDGILGNETLNALNNTHIHELIKEYKDRAILYYSLISAKNPKLKMFLRGWMRRVNSY